MTRKKRTLTDEEQSLWDLIAQKIKPLKAEKKHIKKISLKDKPPSCQKREPPLPLETLSSVENLPSFPTRCLKRIRKVEIHARLDLHGLTREQAKLQLVNFLVSCQKQGYLWVLVITGKGQRSLNVQELYEIRPQKTLRELVPQWLEEPILYSIVSAYATAKPQDGGSGALYVRLKQRQSGS
jgi:DNA-nicking Smr family endonuclease